MSNIDSIKKLLGYYLYLELTRQELSTTDVVRVVGTDTSNDYGIYVDGVPFVRVMLQEDNIILYHQEFSDGDYKVRHIAEIQLSHLGDTWSVDSVDDKFKDIVLSVVEKLNHALKTIGD